MRLFGPCNIDIQEASYMRLLWEEALSPLYIFQVASIIIWCFDDYYYYSAAIFAISVVSITITVVSTKQTARKIREMADYVCLVRVLREGQWSDIASSELVPGDIIDLSGHSFDVAPCDAVLIEGNIIIDESMLTGESVPESKTHMASDDGVLEAIDMAGHTFDPSISRHIIFAGTRVIRARGTPSAYPAVSIDPALNIRATAMVLRTGFCTTKGTLVRSILFPHTTKFRFYRDAIRFLWVLAGIAAVGFVVNTVNLHRMGVPASDIALKALEIITVVVPPALPAAMSIGLVFAARRLRNEGIFCISPTRINVASKVAVMLFDKTGTLTDQGMSMLGVHLANQTHCAFLDMQTEPRALESLAAVLDTGNVVDLIGVPGLSVSSALATCHSLNLVDSALVGDPLEVKMVEFSGWHIEEHDATISQISTAIIACPPQTSLLGASAIVRCFEFVPELRRSSVVTSDQDAHHFAAYVKGAPEVIREICLTETMPGDFDAVLDAHTQCGYRVIALAGKPLKVSADDAQQLKRSDIECNLVFMGFLVFENRLKPVSASVLGELREAHIRTIMCTGDNPLTAVSVARECSLIAPGTTVFVSRLRASTFQDSLCENMFAPLMNVEWKESNGLDVTLDPVTLAPTHANPLDSEATEQAAPYCLAITGNVFAYMEKHAHNTAAWNQVLMRGAVYARMSPEQKAKLVTSLQSIGYCTGFCGDGANDIGALRASDVGISLSEAEASVAAPFTSRVDNISCVVKFFGDLDDVITLPPNPIKP
ncbi:hypothetical protein GGF43_001189 [Coemansia sp. RSA 2618]|nr:hypothetical protein GGF43_001189 [Coemansia sp. RSA 2618]